MIYYFMVFIKLKHETKVIATQRASILQFNKRIFIDKFFTLYMDLKLLIILFVNRTGLIDKENK